MSSAALPMSGGSAAMPSDAAGADGAAQGRQHLGVDEMGELLAAGRGEMDAVGAAQLRLLALDIGAIGVEAAALVGEIVENIDEFRAGAFDVVLEQLVHLDHLAVELVAAHRRQADPEHRHMRGGQRGDDRPDALRVELPSSGR